MTLVLEALLLLAGLSVVVALLFRVRCPPGAALVMTLGSSDQALRSGAPSFRVLSGKGGYRTPSVGAVDVIDLGPTRVDAFVSLEGEPRRELHALLHVRVSSREDLLRRAAVRVLGMPRRDLDAIGEGALSVAVRDAIGGREADEVEGDMHGVQEDTRATVAALLEELGMELVDLRLRIKGE
jgi:hypothetical protein